MVLHQELSKNFQKKVNIYREFTLVKQNFVSIDRREAFFL